MYSFVIIMFNITTIWAQDCDLEIPSGSWSGETTIGVGGVHGSDNVTVTPNGNSVQISDFSAGLFDELGDDGDFGQNLSFNCEGELNSKSISSIYGNIELTSGSWNETNKTITIHWSVPKSLITETTILTFSGQ